MFTEDDTLGRAITNASPSRSIVAAAAVQRSLENLPTARPRARRDHKRWIPAGIAVAALATTAGAVVTNAIVPTRWGDNTGFVEQDAFPMGDGYGSCVISIVTQYLGTPWSDVPTSLDANVAGYPEDHIDLSGGGGDENEPALNRAGMTKAEFAAVRDWIAAQEWNDEQTVALQNPLALDHEITTDLNGETVAPHVAADYLRAEGAGYALVDLVRQAVTDQGLNPNGSAGIGFTVRCDVDG
jgi:hypothetical protein